MQTLEDKLERAELLLTRLHSRLYRTVNAIQKVDRQRKRLVDRIHEAPPGTRVAKPAPETVAASSAPTVATVLPKPDFDDSLDIPAAFRRVATNEADALAKAEILVAQAERKSVKAKASKAKNKAKLAGDLKKMPLTGKQALAAIRG